MTGYPSQTDDDPYTSIFERRESNVRSYCRAFPRKFVRAKGSRLYDDRGGAYLDFLAGCSSLNYGHNDPALKRALSKYIEDDGVALSLDLYTSAKANFLETFERLILEPRGFDYRVMFTGPTGTNAVEAALKLARKATGRTGVVAFTNGFHGMTLGALSCTGNEAKRAGAATPLAGVSHEPFDGYFGPDIDTAAMLDRRLSDPSSGLDAPAAILVEVVQGEGGLNVASNRWLRSVADIANRHGALLIVDDIQAGCGRTGPFFSFEDAGVTPDIVTLAKSLSGMGLPLAVALLRPGFDVWEPGEHNGTFRGNNHAFVTAAAALERYWADAGFENEVRRKGQHLGRRLAEIAKRHPRLVRSVKGRGMMQGIDLAAGELAADVAAACFERGLVIETSGPRDEVVKVLAPLTIEIAELDRGLDILDSSVASLAAPAVVAAQ